MQPNPLVDIFGDPYIQFIIPTFDDVYMPRLMGHDIQVLRRFAPQDQMPSAFV